MYESINLNQRVYMENVISFKGKVTRDEMDEIIQAVDLIILKNSAKKTSNPITATNSVELDKKRILVDWEYMIAVNKEVTVPKGFEFLPVFEVENVMRMRVPATYKSVNSSIPKMLKVVESYCNSPVTPFYVETIDTGIEKYAEIFVGLIYEC